MSAKGFVISVLCVVVLGLATPIIGFIFEHFWPKSMAFSRSGCVMVACSLSVIYLNHYFSDSVKMYRELSEVVGKLPPDILDRQSDFSSSLSEEAKETFRQVPLETMVKGRNSIEKLSFALERLSSKAFVGAEFAIGVVGTLIWGFGDVSIFKTTVVSLLFVGYIGMAIICARFVHPKKWYEI